MENEFGTQKKENCFSTRNVVFKNFASQHKYRNIFGCRKDSREIWGTYILRAPEIFREISPKSATF
jgi:hypothetical protein